MLCVCFIPLPPFVFIGGSHGVSCSRASSNRHHQPIIDLHVEPDGGGAHRLFGRLGRSDEPPTGPPTFPFGLWVTSWAHLSYVHELTSGVLVFCSGGPSIPCFDTCRILICWNVVSWIMPHHYAAKLPQITCTHSRTSSVKFVSK